MNESLQRFDEVDIVLWDQILAKSTERMRQFGLTLSEDKDRLEQVNPEKSLTSPIMPAHGDPVEGAFFEFASNEFTVFSKRTTSMEYAVVETGIWLPVKKLVGSEVELSLENPVFSSIVRRREYIQGIGGEVLEGYRYGLGIDSLTPANEATAVLGDSHLRLAHLMINRMDPDHILEGKSKRTTKPLFRKFKNHNFASDKPATELA